MRSCHFYSNHVFTSLPICHGTCSGVIEFSIMIEICLESTTVDNVAGYILSIATSSYQTWLKHIPTTTSSALLNALVHLMDTCWYNLSEAMFFFFCAVNETWPDSFLNQMLASRIDWFLEIAFVHNVSMRVCVCVCLCVCVHPRGHSCEWMPSGWTCSTSHTLYDRLNKF